MKKISERNHVSRATHGFTLIELMVVLVLLALVAGLAVPSAVSALRRDGVASRGEDLAELLRFAQRHAVTSRHPVQVNLDTTRGLCWATATRTTLPWLDAAPEKAAVETLATLKLTETILLAVESTETGGTAWKTITFQSDGTASDALLRLSDGRGAIVELLVVGTEGAIRQREGAE